MPPLLARCCMHRRDGPKLTSKGPCPKEAPAVGLWAWGRPCVPTAAPGILPPGPEAAGPAFPRPHGLGRGPQGRKEAYAPHTEQWDVQKRMLRDRRRDG